MKKQTDSQELTEELLKKLANNEEVKKLVVDIIFSLDDKKFLDEKQLKQYINENILCINHYPNLKEQDQLKDSYHSAKNDELSALELQYQLRDFIKSNQTRLETINEQKN